MNLERTHYDCGVSNIDKEMKTVDDVFRNVFRVNPVEGSMQKKCLRTPQREDTKKNPTADGTSKLCGRDQGVREPTLRREQLARIEDLRENLQGISSDRNMPGKTSGQSKVTSFIVITLNLEFNITCRKKKHVQFH